ncbi:TetR/AcrR family transcriptional regulator [Streptomyces sp. SID9913]|uniref:ScbR family autoregulator-binding transcription factor n=1 Tax=unclassified Streptomyces TaxID=2593676 RepID=UPI0013BF0F8A|nr:MULTISPECIES: ScbR family autoregulator-binding transcription factor [unclassified Streptomyces]NEC30301.1 TetR/AcrR family transcriptional regulator [Streptomyces sp. SID8111]NED16814.1 TetR/AcrR family transcriptional regulator [Streptomyces sp. SID9913]
MPRQERAVRTRALLLKSAAECIKEHGYDGSSTTDVLRRAGVTRGALYFHFPSKEALADAIVEYQKPLLQPLSSECPLQTVIDLTLSYARMLQTDVILQAAVRLVTEETSYQPGVRPYVWSQETAGDLLRQARDQGELLPHTDPGEVASLVVGAFTGIQLLSQLATGRADLLHRVCVLWRTMLPGIAAPGLLLRLRTDEQRAEELVQVDRAHGRVPCDAG